MCNPSPTSTTSPLASALRMAQLQLRASHLVSIAAQRSSRAMHQSIHDITPSPPHRARYVQSAYFDDHARHTPQLPTIGISLNNEEQADVENDTPNTNISWKSSDSGSSPCSSYSSSFSKMTFVHNPYSFGDSTPPCGSSLSSPLGPMGPLGLELPPEWPSYASQMPDFSSSFCSVSESVLNSPLLLRCSASPMAIGSNPSSTDTSPSSPWPPVPSHVICQVTPSIVIPSSHPSSPAQFQAHPSFPVSPALRPASSPMLPPYPVVEPNLRQIQLQQPMSDDLCHPPILLKRRNGSDRNSTSSKSPTTPPSSPQSNHPTILPTTLLSACDIIPEASADQLHFVVPNLIADREADSRWKVLSNPKLTADSHHSPRSQSEPPALQTFCNSSCDQITPWSPLFSHWRPSPHQGKSAALACFNSGSPPCSHPKPWRRVRAKRGSTFYACFHCDARRRVNYAALQAASK